MSRDRVSGVVDGGARREHEPPRFHDRQLLALLHLARRPFLAFPRWTRAEIWLVRKYVEVQGRLLFGGSDV